MRVAIHLDGAAVRGNERQAMLIGTALQRRGHRVVVACRRRGPVRAAVEEQGLETVGVRPRGDLDLVSLLRFALWLRRWRPDALLLTSWKRAFVAGLAGRLAGVPRIVQRLGGPHPVRRGVRGWKQRVALTRWPHEIVVNSDGMREQVMGELPGLDPRRVRTAPNAVAPATAPPGEAVDLRAVLSLPEDAVVVLAVGGLEPLKGYDELIAALTRLDPRVHAVVAGGGGAARRTELLEAARTAGVADRFHLLGRRGDVPALLAGCDLFVHPSRQDSLPNAVLEAMMAGVPVVATAVPGMAEALEPGDGRPPAGWVVPLGDPAALAAALDEVILQLRSGAGPVAERVAEARWRTEHRFTLDRMADAYTAVLAGPGRTGC